MTDTAEKLRERVKRCVHLAYGDADVNAALDALIAHTAAQARQSVRCPRRSCGGCKKHSQDYERTEQAALVAFRTYGCADCHELAAIEAEVRDAEGGAG